MTMKRKGCWKLLLGRATPTRILTEVALERFVRTMQLQASGRILLAGGASESGSEQAVLSILSMKTPTIVVANIDLKARPSVLMDLSSPWPFRDEVFDVIVSTWVVEHLQDPWRFFQEAYRVLQDEGKIVVAVPFIHRVHGAPFDYWRLTDTALVHLCRKAGFNQVKVERVGGGPFLAAIALLWPLVRIPVLCGLLVLLGFLADFAIFYLIRAFKKGTPLIGTYGLSYICYAVKTGEALQ